MPLGYMALLTILWRQNKLEIKLIYPCLIPVVVYLVAHNLISTNFDQDIDFNESIALSVESIFIKFTELISDGLQLSRSLHVSII